MLKGLIFGPTGAAMTPSHTRRKGKLYRYYVSTDVLKRNGASCPIRRVPAGEIAESDARRTGFRRKADSNPMIADSR